MGFEAPASKVELAVQEIMTPESYAATQHETPYVFKLERREKRLNYFGTPHTSDPEDPVLATIEEQYREANPDLVIVEGFPGWSENREKYEREIGSRSKEEAIQLGESAFMLWLALNDGKEVQSPEPSLADEILSLERSGFTRREIFVFYVARLLSHYQRSLAQESSPEIYMQSTLEALGKATHWRGFQFSFENFAASYKQVSGKDFNIADDLGSVIDPIPWPDAHSQTRINEVGRASVIYRDATIVRAIGKELETHNNLFIVYGASHAVMQEPAMEALLA